MAHRALFAALERLEEKYLPMWQEICELESPTGYKPGVDAVADYCIRHAQSLGWQVIRGHEEVSGDPVCITMNGHIDAAPICLSAHMDTVHPLGAFGSPAVRREGNKLLGPGVSDCKGNIVAAMMVMEALQGCGYDKRPVKLILQSDEETNSAGSQKRTVDFMEQHARGCVCFLNLEPFNPGKVTVQRKGIMRFEVAVTGKAGHAGYCYNFASAIAEAAQKITRLEQWKEPEGITCNIGVIHGGVGSNTVPDSCSFSGECRFASEAQRQQFLACLQEVTDTVYTPGTASSFRILSTRLCMPRTEEAMALLERMNRIWEQAGLPRLAPNFVGGGSDCADMVSRGIVGLDSLGVEGGGLHSLGEWARPDALVTCGQRIGTVVWYL